ncbi:MAG TPA: AAA family ATPase [Herpetosiphonaceae bacterium]
MQTMEAYLAQDRRRALMRDEPLPQRADGSLLFADMSGWTALTASLTHTHGPRHGIDALTQQLNRVYDLLIAQVDAAGGSVVHFAGDGMTCWFDGDTGLRAIWCAQAMQAQLARLPAPGPADVPVALAVRAAITTGTVRRFAVGDPAIQLLDILAGPVLQRLGRLETLAMQHEVIVDAAALAGIAEPVAVRDWRSLPDGSLRAGVLDLAAPIAAPPAPADDGSPAAPLARAVLRPWLLPAVFNHLATGAGEFLTELRPAAILFARVAGPDDADDPAAHAALDATVRQAQAVIQRYEGALLSLHSDAVGVVVGAAFGVPVAHQDDPLRAVAAAEELRQGAPGATAAFQIGLAHGIVRAGAYGGHQRRAYGVLGDEVNLAARLMSQAAPGEVLASEPLQAATAARRRWHPLPQRRLKGKDIPLTPYRLDTRRAGADESGAGPASSAPLVGRAAELALIQERLARAAGGRGQIIAIHGEAGMGKSRLLAEVCATAGQAGWTIARGACPSYGSTPAYGVWQPIWRTLFAVPAALPPAGQQAWLAEQLRALDPLLLARLPLLGTVLGLPLEDNPLTASFDAATRKKSLEDLLVACLRARARGGSERLLLVLDDCHWIDQLSQELLVRISRAIPRLPVALIAVARPPDPAAPPSPLTGLAHATTLALAELPPAESARLLAALLARTRTALPPALRRQLIERSQGIPFYLEELAQFIAEQPAASASTELPASLHSLILSRLDLLSDRQKVTVKVASIIGRLFRASWLWGYQPTLGAPPAVLDDLATLSRLEITPLERPAPDPTYGFKHALTHDVVYDSLPPTMRAQLHEQLAVFLETGPQPDRQAPLLAFHYARSANRAKYQRYARQAGAAAQAAGDYGTAQTYYAAVLPALAEAEAQADVRFQLGTIADILGQWPAALGHYAAILEQAEAGAVGLRWRALALHASGRVRTRQGEYTRALADLDDAEAAIEEDGDTALRIQVLIDRANVQWRQGALAEGRDQLDLALRLALAADDQPALARIYGALGNLTYSQGDGATAVDYQRRGYAIHQAMGNRMGMAASLINLGMAEMIAERLEPARQLLEQALELMQEIGDQRGVMICLLNRATVAYRLEDWEDALERYRQSIVLARDLGDLLAFSYGLLGMGAVGAARNTGADHERALRLLAAAQANATALQAVLEPYEQAIYEEAIARIRQGMDPAAFDAAWRDALAQPLAAVVAAALGEA